MANASNSDACNTDAWDPGQYVRFAAERRAPFDDLLALIGPCPGGRVVDLGCGTGALTAELHARCGAAETIGVDASAAMLERAATVSAPGLSFRLADLATLDEHHLDVVFANASLQWVPDHRALLPRLIAALAPGGQLAFQVPANFDHPSHVLGLQVAAEEPYISALGRTPVDHTRSVLAPEDYATVLDQLGATSQHVRLQIYGHHLESADAVVEWVKGTFLTPIRAGLGPELFASYLERYRARLVHALGPGRPYFYTYKRILAHARFT